MANKLLIKNALITEKATDLIALNKYAFKVEDTATRPEIKKAIEEAYKITVTKVNILNTKSKKRRLGRTVGKKPGYKKAIVTVAKGQKIDMLTT